MSNVFDQQEGSILNAVADGVLELLSLNPLSSLELRLVSFVVTVGRQPLLLALYFAQELVEALWFFSKFFLVIEFEGSLSTVLREGDPIV